MKIEEKSDYLFLAPAAILYISVIVVPAFYSFYLSFFKWNAIAPVKKFVKFNHYIYLFTKDSTFIQALINNVIWVLLTMTFTVFIALLFALLLNRQFKGRTIFRGIFYFPYVLSAIIVGVIWTWVYHPQLGLITNMLDSFGLGEHVKPFLADPNTAFIAIYVAGLWKAYGAPMVLFLAGLQTIPPELYEAAKMDGANIFQTFFRITIPMLKETFVIVFSLQIIISVKIYDIIMAMTGGEPSPATKTHTMATWMIKQSFIFTHAGRGATIACIMVLVLMAVIIPFVLRMAKD